MIQNGRVGGFCWPSEAGRRGTPVNFVSCRHFEQKELLPKLFLVSRKLLFNSDGNLLKPFPLNKKIKTLFIITRAL